MIMVGRRHSNPNLVYICRVLLAACLRAKTKKSRPRAALIWLVSLRRYIYLLRSRLLGDAQFFYCGFDLINVNLKAFLQ